MAHEINQHIAGWLKRECSLTPAQARTIESISKEDWRKVSEVLRFVEETGGTLSVTISDRTGTFKHHAAPLFYEVAVVSTTTDANGKTTQKKTVVNGEVYGSQ